jgi:endonuclease/exonuclease/phosphatase family metal-dependent hydrolase
MYILISSFLLFGVLSGLQNAAAQSPDEEYLMKVMSFNIRYNNPDDGPNAWPHRKEAVTDMIGRRYKADIAGLQEVLYGQLNDLTDELSDYEWVGVGRDDGHRAGEYSPILYRKDKFRLIATNTFWLSDAPRIPGSKSWDAAVTRIVTWATFEVIQTGRQFNFYNTHFDHRGTQARTESAKLLVELISEIGADLPTLITGDFNAREQSEAYKILTQSPFIEDARYVSESGHEGPTTTTSNWLEPHEPESRIDYIFTSDDIRVLNHKIVDDRYGARFPSDHFPVLSDIVLR